VHAAEAQGLPGPHHIRDLGDLLVDAALRVEQASVAGLVEQGPAYLVVSSGASDPLLVAVVDAWRPEGAEQESHGCDDLIVVCLCGEAATGLPEGVMVADESNQIAPDLAAVQGTITLRLEAVKQGLRALPSGQDVPERGIIGVAKNALGQAEVKHRIQAEENCVIAVEPGGILAYVLIVDVVRGSGHLPEQEEAALAEAVGI